MNMEYVLKSRLRLENLWGFSKNSNTSPFKGPLYQEWPTHPSDEVLYVVMWEGADGSDCSDQAFWEGVFALNALHNIPHTGTHQGSECVHMLQTAWNKHVLDTHDIAEYTCPQG